MPAGPPATMARGLRMRYASIIIGTVLVLLLAAGPGSASAQAGPSAPRSAALELKTYLGATGLRVRQYGAASTRMERALAAEGLENAAYVQLYRTGEAEYKRLATSFTRVKAPRTLRSVHVAKLVASIRLVAQAYGIWASAQEQFGQTRDLQTLQVGNTKAKGIVDRAGVLQRAWAKTVRASASRLKVPIPAWLEFFGE